MIRLSLQRRFLVVTSLLLCAFRPFAVPDASESAARRVRFHALLDRPHVPLHPTMTIEIEGEFMVERGQFDSEK